MINVKIDNNNVIMWNDKCQHLTSFYLRGHWPDQSPGTHEVHWEAVSGTPAWVSNGKVVVVKLMQLLQQLQ